MQRNINGGIRKSAVRYSEILRGIARYKEIQQNAKGHSKLQQEKVLKYINT